MARVALGSQKSLDRGQKGYRWAPLNVVQPERAIKIAPHSQKGIRVFIVDRDSMSSELLASAMSRDRRFECATIPPAGLMKTLGRAKADIVVIAVDANLEREAGFDLANAISQAYPNTYIVVLLNTATHEQVINAFRSGARGVFSRQAAMSEFLDCINYVAKGFIWAGGQEANWLLDAFKVIPAPNVLVSTDSPDLTGRELEVVQCAAKGMTNKAIAAELRLSEHTVKNYLFRAFEKLGVSNRVELLFNLTMRGYKFAPTKTETADAGIRDN